MPKVRTSVVLSEMVHSRAWDKVNQLQSDGEKIDFSTFLNRAIVNELERRGDFSVRDAYEEELAHESTDKEG